MSRILDLCSLSWALSAACGAVSPSFGENWPGFRGPAGQGVSHEKNLPLTWSLRENLAWRTSIPGIEFAQSGVERAFDKTPQLFQSFGTDARRDVVDGVRLYGIADTL
jgi:hypothetical protein